MAASGSESITADELYQIPAFEGENRAAVEWIASLMEVLRFDAGQDVFDEGAPAQHMVVVLEGEIHIRPTAKDTVLVVPARQVTGVFPFSRLKTWTGRGWATRSTRIARIHIDHLRELVYRAPLLGQRLISQMTERAREFTRIEESSNRLLALGKLAAGLAHELNNPASAAVRSAARLQEVLTERRKHALAFRSQVIPASAGELIRDLGNTIADCASPPGSMDALERADRESDLADWLEAAGVSTELASELTAAGIVSHQLQPLTALIPKETMELGLRILVADHEIICLARELEEASRRVADLVHAVKTYSYMDQSPTAEVDVEQGIDATLRMFQYQLKHGVQVTRDFAADLPRILANGSALNQVWTNLIDNAIDAMADNPPDRPKMLTVRTCAEPGAILVEIGDNGPGIPAEVQNRMFEPFFTTKSVGEGTGLGLDIVQRIVRNHRGAIRVESDPGRTVFQVRLPLGRR